MIRYESRIRIERPASVVFAALTDANRFGEWTEMVDVQFDSGPPRVGSKGSFRMSKGPVKGRLATEIIELVPDRLVSYRVTHPTLDWTAVSRVEPTGDEASELEYGGTIRLLGWRRLLEPLMAGEVRSEERQEAEKLKAILESEPATVPAPA